MADALNTPRAPSWKIERTISFGHMLQAAVLIVGGVGAYYTLDTKVALLEQRAHAERERQAQEIAALRMELTSVLSLEIAEMNARVAENTQRTATVERILSARLADLQDSLARVLDKLDTLLDERRQDPRNRTR